jgi:predicted RNase H-like nuclease
LSRYLGVDGFRSGWVAAWIDDDGEGGFDHSPSLGRLLTPLHARAMIDIPIGLKGSGHRKCDVAAGALLGPSVFVGACRNLWRFADASA